MDEEGRSKDRAGRRPKRFLTPMQKYEIYLQVIRGEVTMAEAAAAAGVDRTTVVRIRRSPRTGLCRRWPSPDRASRPAPGMSNWTRRKRKSPGCRKRSRKWP